MNLSKQRADWRQIITEIEIFIHQIGSKTDQETEQTQPYTIQITRKLKQTTKPNHEAQKHS